MSGGSPGWLLRGCNTIVAELCCIMGMGEPMDAIIAPLHLNPTVVKTVLDYLNSEAGKAIARAVLPQQKQSAPAVVHFVAR